MLPNNRMDRVTGRTMNEMNSIRASGMAMAMPTPEGTNNLKKPRPLRTKPTITTIRKVISDRATVTDSCEVTVKLPGVRPMMFITAIMANRVNTKGRKGLPRPCPIIEPVRPLSTRL